MSDCWRWWWWFISYSYVITSIYSRYLMFFLYLVTRGWLPVWLGCPPLAGLAGTQGRTACTLLLSWRSLWRSDTVTVYRPASIKLRVSPQLGQFIFVIHHVHIQGKTGRTVNNSLPPSLSLSDWEVVRVPQSLSEIFSLPDQSWPGNNHIGPQFTSGPVLTVLACSRLL